MRLAALLTASLVACSAPVARADDDDADPSFLERLGIGLGLDDGKADDRVTLYEGQYAVQDKPALTLLVGTEGLLITMQSFATVAAGVDLNRWVAFDFAFSTGRHSEDVHHEERREARGQTYALYATLRPLAGRGGKLAGLFFRTGLGVQRMFVEECLANCRKREDQTEGDYKNNLVETGWSTATLGVEVGLGYRQRFGDRGRWMWELLPATFFVPERRIYTRGAPPPPEDRGKSDDVVSPRWLVWRIGIVR